MRVSVGLIMGLALGQTAEAQKPNDLLALQGSWAGSYSCSGGSVPMDLVIAQNIQYPDGLSASFRFGRETNDGPKALGEFFMKVVRLGYNDFRFEPVQWVTRPPGYDWFSMRAQSENGHISGQIEYPTCTTFRVGPAEN